MFKRCLFGSIILHIMVIAGVGIGMRQTPLELDKITYFQLITEIQAADSRAGRSGFTTPSFKGISVPLQLPGATPNFTAQKSPATVSGKPESEAVKEDWKPVVDDGSGQSGPNQGTNPAEAQVANPGGTPDGNSLNGSGAPGGGVPVIPPRRIYSPEPEYPSIARRNNWEGLVTLRVLIKTDGTVGEISIFQSSGFEVLDRSALKTVKKWRYQPALRQGAAVESYLRIPVRFRLGE